MRFTRRSLVQGAAGLALTGCTPAPSAPPATTAPAHPPEARRDPDPPAPAPAPHKRILVLGGTGFAGPPIVRAAVARGHTVTLFNRGKTNPGLFADVETILGDRITQLDLLRGRDWDAVVDTWAPGPTLVRRAAELLRDHVGHYLFVSTISVYKLGRDPIDEGSLVLSLPPGVALADIKKIDDTLYGPLKALAEQAAETAMPGRATSVRAGVLAGPGDPTDRFLYWPLRMSRGGDMIAPGSADDPFQFLDVRDLGDWMVTAIEQRTMGVFNTVGPDVPKFGGFLEACRKGAGGDVRLTWVPDDWLDKNQAAGWDSFPLHVPAAADDSGFGRVSAAKAIARGLRFRSPTETAKDTLAWWATQTDERRAQKRPGIAPEREAELLQRWRKGGG